MTVTGWQGPIDNRKAQTYRELFRIVTHPAFRLGFLDAQRGLPYNHDKIIDRIKTETPEGALQRLGWGADMFSTKESIEVAQYRYEEGRLAVIDKGLRCRAWGHPDYPPASLRVYISERGVR